MNESEQQSTSTDDHLIKDQFIVQLRSKVEPQALIDEFLNYGLSMKKAISAHMNLWVFTYDPQTLQEEEMLKLLKESSLTTQVEFDKQLEIRKDE